VLWLLLRVCVVLIGLIEREDESAVLHCAGFDRSGPGELCGGEIAESVSARARCGRQDGELRFEIELLHYGFLRWRGFGEDVRCCGSRGGGGAARFEGLRRRRECRRDPVQVGELREGVEIEVVRAGGWRAFVLQDSRTGQDLDESGEG